MTTTRSMTMLIHGAAKSGKSSLAVTAPAPRLLLDVESSSRFLNIDSITWDPKDKPPAPGEWDTAVVPVLRWQDAVDAKAWLMTGHHPFASVIIDSVSELQQRHIVQVAGVSQLSQQHWGDVYRTVSGYLRDIRDLTAHPTKPLSAVIVTAMTKQVDGMYKPWCNGQLQAVLPYLLDVTAYLWIEPEKRNVEGTEQIIDVRKLLTRRTPQFEAGERVGGKLPRVLVLPEHKPGEVGDDIVRMINAIFGPEPRRPKPTSEAVEQEQLKQTTPTQQEKVTTP